MKQDTLTHIKKQIAKLLVVLDAMRKANDVADDKTNDITGLTTLSVIVQNMAFNPVDCHGYSLEREVKKLYAKLEVLKAISEFAESHLETWVYFQIDCIIDGNVQSEFYS